MCQLTPIEEEINRVVKDLHDFLMEREGLKVELLLSMDPRLSALNVRDEDGLGILAIDCTSIGKRGRLNFTSGVHSIGFGISIIQENDGDQFKIEFGDGAGARDGSTIKEVVLETIFKAREKIRMM